MHITLWTIFQRMLWQQWYHRICVLLFTFFFIMERLVFSWSTTKWKRIQISRVFDWNGLRKYYTYLVTYILTQNHDDWLVYSDGSQFCTRAKKFGKYCKGINSMRPHSALFLDESNLTLTSFLGLDAKRISDRNKRLFHWSNEEGFISNQSKMLYYWGGTFSLKKLVNMSELEEVSVKDCPIVCRNPLDIWIFRNKL